MLVSAGPRSSGEAEAGAEDTHGMRRSRPSEAAPRHSLERKKVFLLKAGGPSHRPELAAGQATSQAACSPGVRAALRLPPPPAPSWARGCREGRTPGQGKPACRACRPGYPAFVPRAGKGGGRGRVLILPRSRSRRGTSRVWRGVKARGSNGWERLGGGRAEAEHGQTAIKTSEALTPPRREKGEKNPTPEKKKTR